MFLPGVPSVIVDQFRGAITRLDPYTVPITNGLYAQNVTFIRGGVATRYGHSAVFNQTDGAITALLNWVFYDGGSPTSVVVYYAPSVGVQGLIQGINFTFTLMASIGSAGAVMVPDGNRVYSAFYDSTGRKGFSYGQVFGKGVGSDPLFASPMSNVPVITEPAAGLVTAGTHRIGYLPTTRNGSDRNLSPFAAGAFAPVEFTASGSKNIQVAIPGPVPSYMVGNNNVQVVMSTAANLNRYFLVPGAIASLDGITGATITLSISDDDLTATGTDVTNQRTLMSNGLEVAPFNPPIKPWALFTFSSRMIYCAADAAGNPGLFISEPDDYQHITLDQHFRALEGLAQPIQGFSMRGVAYVGTQFSFFSVEDNGDVPVSWSPPQKVDGSVGILSPTCIAVNQAAGYAAIAAEKGLYWFQGGVFPPLPLSYYQSDWARIDWTKATQVQIVDDRLNRRIIVNAPLVAAPVLVATPTSGAGIYQMTWDYTEGDTPETVKYSIQFFANYPVGAMGVIQNIANYLTEVWYAPSSNGYVIRQNDGSEANPYRDVAANNAAVAINSRYRTAHLPGAEDPMKTVNDYHGAKLRITGAGNLAIKVYGVDGVISITPKRSPLSLNRVPGREEMVKWFLRSEQESLELGTNDIDSFFSLSRIEAGYTNAMPQR
jgi:hypothetical protein